MLPATRDYKPRFDGFHDLMPHRVREILLVSSLYNTFILEEDGLLADRIFGEYLELNLHHPPRVTQVSSPEKAERRLAFKHFDLVVTMTSLSDRTAFQFGKELKEKHPELPHLLLVHDTPYLAQQLEAADRSAFDRIFVWSGHAYVLLTAIKLVEDELNVIHDVRAGNVRVVIVVEDSPRYYSTLLPLLYTEIIRYTQQALVEGLNEMDRLRRMRARAKIVLAENFEQGLDLYRRFRANVLGMILDIRFPHDGRLDARAGIELLKRVRSQAADLPCLLYSADPGHEKEVASHNASFVSKDSPTFVQDLRRFILDNFGFGDFIFRLSDGREVARGHNLIEFPRVLSEVPVDSVTYHASRNHFSNWFMAHGEFDLAERIRPVRVEDFPDGEALRRYLVSAMTVSKERAEQGVIADFSRWRIDPACQFARLGRGSIGGKARSVAFINTLLARGNLQRRYPDVEISIPKTVALATNVFDQFLERNDLHAFVTREPSDDEINARFGTAALPDDIVGDLAEVVQRTRHPLAVRSSSLLEDSGDLPLAGLYSTYMLPNNAEDVGTRLDQLCRAIKLVYASTFHKTPRAYLAGTPYRVDQEKMGVLLQELVGRRHGDRFYPDFSGVAQSYNFYPVGHMKAEDGVSHVALGLGKTVVDGHQALRFCPKHPKILMQLATVQQALKSTQREFYALDLGHDSFNLSGDEGQTLLRLPIREAEADGTLTHMASVLCREDGVIRDGLDYEGTRIVTFANILKWNSFPLAGILDDFLEVAPQAMGGPMEVEFAVNLARAEGEKSKFSFLQIRPLPLSEAVESVAIDGFPAGSLLCATEQALGHGVEHSIRDIVFVRPDRFERNRTPKIAEDIGRFNQELGANRTPYLLVGVGRWGSTDPWLGIPVSWDQIAGATALVEVDALGDFQVEPSQGTHFFHNIISFRIKYLTLRRPPADGVIDWDWLLSRTPLAATDHVAHLRLEQPIEVRVDGRTRRGAILKGQS